MILFIVLVKELDDGDMSDVEVDLEVSCCEIPW